MVIVHTERRFEISRKADQFIQSLPVKLRRRIKEDVACLLDYIEAEGFRGHDPYDALNSLILRALSFRRKFLRIAFIQILKRFPVNLRPLILAAEL